MLIILPLQDFEALYNLISRWSLTSEEKSSVHFNNHNNSTLHVSCDPFSAKEWVKLFLTLSGRCEGHQKNVTPNMHSMVYHVPAMIDRLGSIKPFSGQGMYLIIRRSTPRAFGITCP